MGEFLNMNTSTKNNPNENYAREIMQLFSIGTELLNQDGTTQNDAISGQPLPSYDQSVIDKLKRVFTGWYIPKVSVTLLGDTDDTGDYLNPMVQHKNGSNQEDRHDTTSKDLFLGFLPNQNGEGAPTAIAAGQTGGQDLNGDRRHLQPPQRRAVPRARAHPQPRHVEPLARLRRARGRVLQRQRQRACAAASGRWSRPSCSTPEARNAPTDPTYGKLKEPALYINNLLRAFDAMSANRAQQSDGYVNSPWSRDMGQEIFKPPTVFSYFPQDYFAPPASAGVLGPEFGIMDASTSLKRANFINQMTFSEDRRSTAARTPAILPTGPRST